MTDALGQLLEFRLGSDQYCIDIAHVDEIVDATEIRRLPNSPPHIKGVTDLRGRTTTVVDPSVVLDIDEETDWSHIVVLDSSSANGSDTALGWLVGGVDQVTDADTQDIDRTAATDDDAIEGVISRDSGFVVQVDPTAVSC